MDKDRERCIDRERCRYRYTERGIVGEMERYIVIDREGIAVEIERVR